MRVLLIDVDSKIPNLALMKLSAFHKNIGNEVGFNVTNPDIVHASVIFRKNKHKVDGLKYYYPDARISIGGSGYDLMSELTEEIEYIKPDYSLYPDCDYSIGFTTRGCGRNNKTCPFCIVPQKEGQIRIAQHPREWYNPEFKKIMFLDNNILFKRKWFFEVIDWCIQNNLEVWFTQGLDIRLLDLEIATKLYQMKIWKGLFFAWDHLQDEKIVKTGIRISQEAGFTKSKLKNFVQFYVYVDNPAGYDIGLYRARELKKLNCNAFVMYNCDNKPTPAIQKLKRWANRKQLFWSIDIDQYTRNVA